MEFHSTDNYSDAICSALDSFGMTNVAKELNMSLSGSTVLNIIQGKTEFNDLDLYFHPHQYSDTKLGDIITNLVIQGYRPKKNKFDARRIFAMQFDQRICTRAIKDVEAENLELMYRDEDCMKIVSYFGHKGPEPDPAMQKSVVGPKVAMHKMVARLLTKIRKAARDTDKVREYKYFSLKEYIDTIVRFYNPSNDKEIDLICIKKGVKIGDMIKATFDYDIIRNYTKMRGNKWKIYSQMPIDYLKTSRTATMTLDHFCNRVADNAHEFNNFLTRFIKYHVRRGYKTMVGPIEITPEIIASLVELVYLTTKMNPVSCNEPAMNTDMYSEARAIQRRFPYVKNMHTTVFVNHSMTVKLIKETGYFAFQTIKFYNMCHMQETVLELGLDSVRPFVDEIEMNADYKRHYMPHKVINKLILPIITPELSKMEIPSEIKQFIADRDIVFIDTERNRTDLIIAERNSCVVCLDDDMVLFDMYCGNNHKTCGRCLKQLIKNNHKCPMCRGGIFTQQ